jgi:BirA family transcriptional regulator, biotin operon repressor / biotin---[acetyl-CoA-carboxylase] ligase
MSHVIRARSNGGFALLAFAGPVQEPGFRLARHGQLVSTNDEAMACGRRGDPGRLWIIADAQSGGRGRNGRVWWSPPGNLYASLLLIDPAQPRRAAELGFVASVALARALRDILGGDSRIAIKWPNDILHNGAKLAGILLESAVLPDGRFACVAGMGANCNRHPLDGLYEATDLAAIAGRLVAPEEVFEHLSAAMAHWLGVFAEGAGFEAIRAEWLSLAAGLGARISVSRPSETVAGVFRTIDASGRLVLERESDQVAIEAGDVFLSAPPTNASLGQQ